MYLDVFKCIKFGLFQMSPQLIGQHQENCVAGGVISAYWAQDGEMCMRLKSYLNAPMYKHTDTLITHIQILQLDIFI